MINLICQKKRVALKILKNLKVIQGVKMKKTKTMKIEKENEESTGKSAKRKALRDFTIRHNDFYLEIKKGDDLSKIPVKFMDNLKTEKVL